MPTEQGKDGLPMIPVSELSLGDIILDDGMILTVVQDWHGAAGVEKRCLPGAHLYESISCGYGTNLNITTLSHTVTRVARLAPTAPAFTPVHIVGAAVFRSDEYRHLADVELSNLPDRFVYLTEGGGAAGVSQGTLGPLDAESLLPTDSKVVGLQMDDVLTQRDQHAPSVLILTP